MIALCSWLAFPCASPLSAPPWVLQEFGHRVRLASHANYREFIMEEGLEFLPSWGDPKLLAECELQVSSLYCTVLYCTALYGTPLRLRGLTYRPPPEPLVPLMLLGGPSPGAGPAPSPRVPRGACRHGEEQGPAAVGPLGGDVAAQAAQGHHRFHVARVHGG